MLLAAPVAPEAKEVAAEMAEEAALVASDAAEPAREVAEARAEFKKEEMQAWLKPQSDCGRASGSGLGFAMVEGRRRPMKAAVARFMVRILMVWLVVILTWGCCCFVRV